VNGNGEIELDDRYSLDSDGMIWDEVECRYLEDDEKDQLFPDYDNMAQEAFWE